MKNRIARIEFLKHHEAVVNRLISICQSDDRIVAAFIGGSYARGDADSYSDLDLYVITTDESFDLVVAEREALVNMLGQPLFLEDFGAVHGLFFILADETEGELWIGRIGDYHHLHEGPYHVLIDKRSILSIAKFPGQTTDPISQLETLRQLISGFWHETSHFVKAVGRGQLWFAYGQLEVMRQICVNLARLEYRFADAWVGDEPYFKIETVFPVEQLESLRQTYCPMELGAMLNAARVIFQFYQELAPRLAEKHGIEYQDKLEQMFARQLEQLM